MYHRKTTAYPDSKRLRYKKCGDVLLIPHIFTIAKTSEVVPVSKLPPCVARHVWGD
jgi:hypothetical protein